MFDGGLMVDLITLLLCGRHPAVVQLYSGALKGVRTFPWGSV